METGVSCGAGQEFIDKTALHFFAYRGNVLMKWRDVDEWQVRHWEGIVPGCPY